MHKVCRKKLHVMSDDNIITESGKLRDGTPVVVRRCKACRYAGGGQVAKCAREAAAKEYATVFLPLVDGRTGWEEQAACRGRSWSEFIPANVQPASVSVRATIEKYCDNCPVRSMCLATALSYGDVSGIWGGYLFPQQITEVDVPQLIKEIT